MAILLFGKNCFFIRYMYPVKIQYDKINLITYIKGVGLYGKSYPSNH